MKIFLPRLAKNDLKDAFIWYEEHERGLGDSFLLSFEASLEFIIRNPYLFPVIKRDVRRKLIRKFPYIIYYYVHSGRIIIIGVLHSKRNPDEWKLRIS